MPWCTPSLAGVTAEDRAHLLHDSDQDPDSLRTAAEADGDLAGILVSAFRHGLSTPQEEPDPDFAATTRALCDAAGAALILDDVGRGSGSIPEAAGTAPGCSPT